MKTSFVWSKYLAIKFVTLSDRSLFIAGGGGRGGGGGGGGKNLGGGSIDF